MTVPIAERPLYALVNGAEIATVVQIWPPEADERGAWRCRFTFRTGEGAPMLEEETGWGVDSVQALHQALVGVGWSLDRSGIEWSMFSRSEAGFDPLAQDDGFPRNSLNVMFLGSDFRKRMEAYVSGEAQTEMLTPRPQRLATRGLG